jgi:hypothetical protein
LALPHALLVGAQCISSIRRCWPAMCLCCFRGCM